MFADHNSSLHSLSLEVMNFFEVKGNFYAEEDFSEMEGHFCDEQQDSCEMEEDFYAVGVDFCEQDNWIER